MIRYITPKLIEISDNYSESKICIDFESETGHIDRVKLKYDDFVNLTNSSNKIVDYLVDHHADDIREKIECH